MTKTSPLTIRVDNRFDISGDAIVVMKEFQAGFYPTHYHTGVKGSPSTEEKSGGSGDASFAAHSHTLKGNYQTNTDAKSEYYYRITDVTDFEVAQIDKRTASVKFTAETIFGEIPIESEVNANV